MRSLKALVVFAGVVTTMAAASNTSVLMAPRAGYVLFDPISTEPVDKYFVSTDRHWSMLPPRFVDRGVVGNVAIPTNNWWGNMIASTGDPEVQPVWSSPYTLRPSIAKAPFGLAVSHPYDHRQFGDSTGNGNANKYYYHDVIHDFIFSAAEFTGAPTFSIRGWDDMAVTMRFAQGNSVSTMDSTIINGNAYITVKYDHLIPKFTTVHAFSTINGAAVGTGMQVSGNRFVFTLNNGQQWVLYLSASTTLRVSDTSEVVSTSYLTGIARVARVLSDSHISTLDGARNCVIEGVSVEALDDTSYSFNWKTSGDCTSGLLHYLQTHHIATLDKSTAQQVSGADMHSATRGPLFAVKTLTSPPVVRFKETINMPADFYPPRAPLSSAVSNIKKKLIADINANWDIPIDRSYYFNGKLAQLYAELCLVANDAKVTGKNKAKLLSTCLKKFEQVMLPFTKNSWKYPLQYDTVYRGILSSQGFAVNDAGADFGNTAYNDHHYHYGYWIHAAAIMNYLNPKWSQIGALNRMTTFLIRDVTNPSTSDSSFPKFRQFDWYRGHSYSHGVTPLGDGKDEESTSEETNFHYGVFLFGKATGNTRLQSMAKLMLKVNTRTVQTYFLMLNNNAVHPATIVPNKVLGILFDNKADYATWFSAEKFAIHGIQMIPATPVTEFVRTKQFVQEEWDQVLSKIPDVVSFNAKNTWMSLLYINYATVNKNTALQKLEEAQMDDGLTRTWALYMAATRA